MTTPQERTRALLLARALLQELAAVREENACLNRFRSRARGLLRHFPEPLHLDLSADVLPGLWANPHATKE
ncbi:BPSL0761 family protein [Trinickia mobilis]|uniref:BPSL0761 family protein n=1 Tax=Trinickia mobilis TaxID=2816356 RepID=UPI001A8E16A8|nr:BPSL0761 family protein [Trinickia mobilis]